MSVADTHLSDRSAPVLDWLATDLSSDAELELAALVRHVDALSRPDVGRAEFHRCLDLLHTRSRAISRQFRANLATSNLPLSVGLHRSASRLVGALGKIAGGYEEALNEVRHRLVRNLQRTPDTISGKGLAMLGEQLTVVHLAGNSAPYEFWLRAHALFVGGQAEAPPDSPLGDVPESTLHHYKYLLAFATAQPEGLSGREIAWLAEFLTVAATAATVRNEAPGPAELGWFWIDPDQDTAPISISRRNPPPVEGLIYFSADELARGATALIEQLDSDDPPPPGLPIHLNRAEAATLLRRVREYWATPPKREHVRRRNQYAVFVCCGLDVIWRMLRETGVTRQARYATEWMVVNESPTGYAVMQVTGTATNLNAGMAVALRRGDDDPWTLCVVRWIRTETPEQVELGLQIIANAAKPVTVGFRSSEKAQPMKPALVLPAVPALGRQQAILAPAGSYTARRFMLVSDINRLYIAQGRLLSLDMQTSTIELFQYEIDPYPL